MTDALLLLARDTPHARTVARTHAARLRDRAVVDLVETAHFDSDPARELSGLSIDADTVYAMPLVATWSYATREGIPTALSSLDATVHHCEPIGRHPAITEALVDRIEERASGTDPSVILVGLGSSSVSRADSAVETHAQRLRANDRFPEVTTAYLLQNPAVECARYTVSGTAVAAPMFVAETPASTERIPEQLDLDRGGLSYADPLGEHPTVTDAIHSEIERASVLDSDATIEPTIRAVATDGSGDA